MPETLTMKNSIQIHYDHSITLVQNVENSDIKPDILVVDLKNKEGLIIEVGIHADCNKKIKVATVVMGATGIYKLNLNKN